MDEYISPFNSPLCDRTVDMLSAIVSGFFTLVAFLFTTVTELIVGTVSLLIFIASTTVKTALSFVMSLISAIVTLAVHLIIAAFPPIVTLVQLLKTCVAYPVINWPALTFISLAIAALSYAAINSSARSSVQSHFIQPTILHFTYKLNLWKGELILTYETWKLERAEKAATKARVQAEAEAAAAATRAQAQAQAAAEAAKAQAKAKATAAFEAGQARARGEVVAVSAATISLPATPTIPRKTPTTLLPTTRSNGYYTPLYPPRPRTPTSKSSSSSFGSSKRSSPNEIYMAHQVNSELREWHHKTGRYSDWARSYRPPSQQYPHAPAPEPSSPHITGLILTASPPRRYHPHPLSFFPPEQMHLLYGGPAQSTTAPQPVALQTIPAVVQPAIVQPAVIQPIVAQQPVVQAQTPQQQAVPTMRGGGGSSVLANAAARLSIPSILSTTPACTPPTKRNFGEAAASNPFSSVPHGEDDEWERQGPTKVMRV